MVFKVLTYPVVAAREEKCRLFSGLARRPPQTDKQRQDEQRVSQDELGEALEAAADDDDGRRPRVGARHRQDLRLGQDGAARLPDPGRVRLAKRQGTSAL